MLKIRLQRTGRKNNPAFRIVLTDSKNAAKSGKFKEILGSYDLKKGEIIIKEDRIKHIFQYMEYDNLSDSQHNFIISLEEQFNEKGYLSQRQLDALEDIFRRAAEA